MNLRSLLPFLFTCVAAAQGTGEIHGSVADPNELAIHHASVRALHVERGVSRTAYTDERGDFVLPLLPIGTYSLEIEQQGFKAARRTGIRLTANENVRVDFKLELGAVSETVSVRADA